MSPPRGDRAVEIEVPPRVEYVGLVRQMVSEVGSLTGMDEGRLYDLRVAVSEACTNAVEAHRNDGVHEVIAIRCEVTQDHLRVSIVDRGAGFDVSKIGDLPDPTDPRRLEFEHGLGLPLIRVLTDEAEIDSSADGTSVTVTMRLVKE